MPFRLVSCDLLLNKEEASFCGYILGCVKWLEEKNLFISNYLIRTSVFLAYQTRYFQLLLLFKLSLFVAHMCLC